MEAVVVDSPKREGTFEKRIHEVDLLRGILILLVMMDHIFYYLNIYNGSWYNATNIEFFRYMYVAFNFYWRSGARKIVREICLFGFVFLSGVSCAFSKDNWKRAGQMLLCYFALLILTNVFDAIAGSDTSSFRIDFNVIGVLAWSILLYCFFQNKSWKTLLAVALCCFLFTIVVIPAILAIDGMTTSVTKTVSYYGGTYTTTIENVPSVYLPILWDNMEPCGDWMPLFPYIVYFFAGAVASRLVYKNKESLFPNSRRDWERPFCFVGRHTMYMYLGHIPIIWIVFLTLNAIILGIAGV